MFGVVNLHFWLCVINDDSAERFIENILTLLSMYKVVDASLIQESI
jgi:hypothetical protein